MKNKFNYYWLLILVPVIFISWYFVSKKGGEPIRYLEYFEPKNTIKTDNKTHHTIPDFEFINQDSVKITQKDFTGKIYVADFFFTTCPTICPKMKTQMLRIYKKFKDNPKVAILSHTIDPRHDTPAVLKEFSKNLGIQNSMWQMVTGDKAKIYEIGQKSYMVSATDDPTQPGGIVHSGAFILVDKNRHIRGIYDGTVPKKVDKLMEDMEILLKEL